jgi:hypothetical protein
MYQLFVKTTLAVNSEEFGRGAIKSSKIYEVWPCQASPKPRNVTSIVDQPCHEYLYIYIYIRSRSRAVSANVIVTCYVAYEIGRAKKVGSSNETSSYGALHMTKSG